MLVDAEPVTPTWPSVTPNVDGCTIYASIMHRGGDNGFTTASDNDGSVLLADASPVATEKYDAVTNRWRSRLGLAAELKSSTRTTTF